jgi:hypothetical protein
MRVSSLFRDPQTVSIKPDASEAAPAFALRLRLRMLRSPVMKALGTLASRIRPGNRHVFVSHQSHIALSQVCGWQSAHDVRVGHCLPREQRGP